MIKACGTFTYDPRMRGQKVEEPFWLILSCDPEIGEYYSWLLLKQHCVKLRRPGWKAHISVIRGEKVVNSTAWGKYAGRRVGFEYEPIVKTNGKHYWLSVESEDLLDVREFYGLPRVTYPKLHLTLGNDFLSEVKGEAHGT